MTFFRLRHGRTIEWLPAVVRQGSESQGTGVIAPVPLYGQKVLWKHGCSTAAGCRFDSGSALHVSGSDTSENLQFDSRERPPAGDLATPAANPKQEGVDMNKFSIHVPMNPRTSKRTAV